MIDEEVQKRIISFTPEYKDFVQSDFIPSTAAVFADGYNFDITQRKMLEDRLALYLLLYINKEELIETINKDCGVERETATAIVADIFDNLPNSLTESIELAYKKYGGSQANTEKQIKESLEPDLTAPNLSTESRKAPEPQPSITVQPATPVVESERKVGLNPTESEKQIPTGKMVGLAKEETESNIKGMRTMRGDINRLRSPENPNDADSGSNFTKPFRGT